MSDKNTQKLILEQVDTFMCAFQKIKDSEDSFNQFFLDLGWDFSEDTNIPIAEIQSSITDLLDLVDDLKQLIADPPTSLLDLVGALELTQNLFNLVDGLGDFVNSVGGQSIPASQKVELSNLPNDVFDHLTTSYLEVHAEKLFTVLTLIGIVDSDRFKDPVPAINNLDGWSRRTYNISRIRYDKIGSLFSDPVQYLKDEFYPASQQLTTTSEAKEFSDKLFPRLELVFEALGFEVGYGVDPDYVNLMDANTYDIIMRTLIVTYLPAHGVRVGASFSFAPDDAGGHGLVITPFGDWNFVHDIKDWIIFCSISGAIDGFSIGENGFQFPSNFGLSSFQTDVILAKKIISGTNSSYQVGSTSGTRLEIGQLAFGGKLHVFPSELTYGISLLLERASLYIGGADGDSFLSKIFQEPVKIDFDVIAGWQNDIGFYFQGSGSLKIAIPVHKDFLGIELKTIFVSLTFENEGAQIELSADTGLELGPFVASINRLGIESNIEFQKGNLGPVNGNLKFKPPSGIGFTIDANAFKGGGYLSFDFEEERYVGALELSVKDKVALKVIGVLTTKLPGNDDGYSLLLLITAEFEPINLGFGFTLNGVGGLIALNRTMNLDYLRAGVKANSLDSILFPQDPVANINQIISDLESAFPVQEGRYAFGPMAIIGWGTPTLITIELGLMVEVPAPVRLAILGVLKAILPSENKQLLKLQVNFLGAIDFEAKFITFDASIFESKLLSFTLEGDMAFRLKYGGNNNFLFSIGGFHPAYTPPPLQLPTMKRLTINLVGGDNPRITLTSYFAVTSNTVQFGSAVDFYYKITNKWSVIGYLGFDILIQFNPFYLNAAIAAQLALMRDGETIVGIYLGGSVAGPAPWHVQGKAEIKICGITLSANFDKTFGQPETTTLPNIDVLPKLQEALQNKANWQAYTPPASNLLVTMRELNNAPGDVVAHPYGSVGVSQKVVPLNTAINKFGTQRPADYQIFEITLADESGTDFENEDLNELFAPAEFIQMTDSAKLSRNSFEQFNSGASIKGNNEIKSSYLMERELEFEMVIMDSRNEPEGVGMTLEKPMHFKAFTQNGAAAKSKLGTKSKPESENAPPKVNTVQEKYVIANVEDLTQYNSLEAGSEAEARVLMESLIGSDPTLTDQIQVVPIYEVA